MQLQGELPEGCIIWLGNPLNPTGTVFPREQILALLERVEAAHGWLIADEAFIGYCPEHTSAELLAAHERLLIVGSMTKILGIPGVRLGYLCAQPQVLERLLPRQIPWALNCFAGKVLCALPEHRGEFEHFAAANARRRDALRAALEQLGAFVYPSQAPFLLADFSRPVRPLGRALKQRGILVRHFTAPRICNYNRITIGTMDQMQKLVSTVKQIIGGR